ncbi:MAG TPA: metallophosphoesterase [Saprospiraceae bacterium]|nr:metallophosphoesterase [Saprospiraceae bacterium]
MKQLYVIILILFLKASASGQLVPLSSVWRYYDLGQAPPIQTGNITWKQIAYNHTSWSEGPAQLGYGDGDEATTISSSTLTGYFRQTFNVDDVADYSGLTLQLTYDDGAVVYLNGEEIWRVNMPGGTINYNTFASGSSPENNVVSLSLGNLLENGLNLVAVEVHQHSASSSDISFALSITGVPANGVAVITRGPYLQSANNNSVIVRWRTNIPTQSIIDYGASVSSLTNTVSNLDLKTEHILSVSNLNSSTKYFYQLRNTSDTIVFPSANLYFKTYPVPGTAAPLIAWILGDCGTANNDARNVRNAYYNYIGTQHTDMMFFLVDNAYVDGTDVEYQTAIFQNMYEDKLKNTIAWSCLGNHDGNSANSNTQTGPYYDIFSFPTNGQCGGEPSGTEAYYSFDYGNVHFVILDSYETSRSVTGPMHTWCQLDLSATNADWIIAIWHHPAYSRGSHDSDVDTELKEMRQNFLPLFESYGVDLVLSGHSHSYERTFLMNGHYGFASTFNINTHTVGVNGDGSGQLANGEPYYKAPVGPEAGDGAVYITTGSAGKISSGPMNHPAMYYDAVSLGSCVLKINQDTLSVIFLRQSGAVDDEFTLVKDQDCVPGVACNDNDACTFNDILDNNCYCHGIHAVHTVTTTSNSGAGSLRTAITNACEGDTIVFSSAINDTIRLNTQISIDKDLVIRAVQADDIVISGQLQTRIFQVLSANELTLIGLTLYGGYHLTAGGAFQNSGIVNLEFTEFIKNKQGTIPKSWTNNGVIRIREGSSYLRSN